MLSACSNAASIDIVTIRRTVYLKYIKHMLKYFSGKVLNLKLDFIKIEQCNTWKVKSYDYRQRQFDSLMYT